MSHWWMLIVERERIKYRTHEGRYSTYIPSKPIKYWQFKIELFPWQCNIKLFGEFSLLFIDKFQAKENTKLKVIDIDFVIVLVVWERYNKLPRNEILMQCQQLKDNKLLIATAHSLIIHGIELYYHFVCIPLHFNSPKQRKLFCK